MAHLYKLSDFNGTLPFSGVRVRVDRTHDEVYVISGSVIQVFNAAGMEVYRFGDNPALGHVRDLFVDNRGDLVLLSYDTTRVPGSDRPAYLLLRCDFRGEPREKVVVKGLPARYAEIRPQLLFARENGFLLVSRVQMLAVETDAGGTFRRGYDFAELIGIDEKDRSSTEIFGFNVDNRGNMLFTVPTIFQAFSVSPDGAVKSFGKKGSSPGSFGVVAGIAADDHGNYVVADSQRNVVMVFDKQFRFLTEFGSYGFKPENLIRPRDLSMGNAGKLYIVQLRKQGVSVFSVNPN